MQNCETHNEPIHDETIQDVKISVSCDVDNIFFNKYWPTIYLKYKEKCLSLNKQPLKEQDCKSDFLQCALQAIIQLKFLDGFFDNDMDIDFLVDVQADYR